MPTSANIYSTFYQNNTTVESFTSQSAKVSLLTPYSEQGFNFSSALSFDTFSTSGGLNFSYLYATGGSLEYAASNNLDDLNNSSNYINAYSILITSVNNSDILTYGMASIYGSGSIYVSAPINYGSLSGDFKFNTSNYRNSDTLNVTGYSFDDSGSFSLRSGVYGCQIQLGTNANAFFPMNILVNSLNGSNNVPMHDKYFEIINAVKIISHFVFKGNFYFPVVDISDMEISSYLPGITNFDVTSPFTQYTASDNQSLEYFNGKLTQISSPTSINMVLSKTSSNKAFYVLTAPNSKVIYNGEDQIMFNEFVLPSNERTYLNVSAGAILGTGVSILADTLRFKASK